MFFDEENTLDIPHSLPVLSHSVPLAQRSPAAGYIQQTKYLPEYGGCLETPKSKLKNNSLLNSIPFDTRARCTFLESSSHSYSKSFVSSQDCLVVASYLNSDTQHDLSVIRLLGSKLVFDSMSLIPTDQHETHSYSHIDCKGSTGIKHQQDLNEFLLVKLEDGVNLLKLNSDFDINLDNAVAAQQLVSLKDRQGFYLKDVCLNPHNKTIVGTASDHSDSNCIRVFDLSSNHQDPFQTIEWPVKDTDRLLNNTSAFTKELRGRIVRTFIPMSSVRHGIQQLDNIPSHLVNMLVTDDLKISLVDPRMNELTQNYVIKSEMPSFYPIEFLRRTVSSRKNEYQFYSMSNVHLRVFDTRYPGIPVSQLSHMLSSDTYDLMEMALVQYRDSDQETLCCSSMGRISFMTFDQSQEESLINPRSLHLPYHDSSLNIKNDIETFGLCALSTEIKDLENTQFSIFQLGIEGNLLVRTFSKPTARQNICSSFELNLSIGNDGSQSRLNSRRSVTVQTIEHEPRQELHNREQPVEQSFPLADVIDSRFLDDIEDKLESKRAIEKYRVMRQKLLGSSACALSS